MLKKVINNIGLLVGICGLIIFMFGLTETNINHKNLIVFFATFFLFLSAIIQKEPFFSGLQGIAFVSAIMVFLIFLKYITWQYLYCLQLFFQLFILVNIK